MHRHHFLYVVSHKWTVSSHVLKCLYYILFKTQNYQEGLRYIGRLPFEQAESNMKRYGKTLMHHVPEGTTLLLKGLCTNYQPSGDAAERDSLDRGRNNKVSLRGLFIIFVFKSNS